MQTNHPFKSTMKTICLAFVIFLFASCSSQKSEYITASFVDSLTSNFDSVDVYKSTDADLKFWKDRIDVKTFDVTNGGRYASMLAKSFAERGDIKIFAIADSINLYNGQGLKNTYAPPYYSLIYSSITQHQFARADSFFQIANKIGLEPFQQVAAEFDLSFELGKMEYAKELLEKMSDKKSYAYLFRKAKMLHYEADLEAAIKALQDAVDASSSAPELQNVAYSNLADMYLHNGDIEKSKENYMLALKQNASNMHSILGLGWLSLLHDKSDSSAERLFKFVDNKIISPEAIFRQIQLQQARKDTAKELALAERFVALVTQKGYNNMYNKYLIELYTGILSQPDDALLAAENELKNRNTPQTNAWYAYALMKAGKSDAAYEHYKKFVAGKPLEGLELYYMGKLMEEVKKGYNANQFFTEAKKNLYDLSPNIQEDLKTKD